MEFKLDKYNLNPILEPRRNSSWDAAQIRNPAAIFHDDKDLKDSKKIRIYHGFGSDKIKFRGKQYNVRKERIIKVK